MKFILVCVVGGAVLSVISTLLGGSYSWLEGYGI